MEQHRHNFKARGNAQGQGDIVQARLLPDQPQQVLIERIEGDGGRLPLEAAKNCAGIAALETMKALGYPPFGVSLSLIKVISSACLLRSSHGCCFVDAT